MTRFPYLLMHPLVCFSFGWFYEHRLATGLTKRAAEEARKSTVQVLRKMLPVPVLLERKTVRSDRVGWNSLT